MTEGITKKDLESKVTALDEKIISLIEAQAANLKTLKEATREKGRLADEIKTADDERVHLFSLIGECTRIESAAAVLQ